MAHDQKTTAFEERGNFSKVSLSEWWVSPNLRRVFEIFAPSQSQSGDSAARGPVAAPVRGKSAVLDMTERLVVLGLYGYLFVRFLQSFLETYNPVVLLLLTSECLVVVFVVFRRSARDISLKPRDWLLALGGTTAPLFVQAGGGLVLVPPTAAACLMLAGILLQIAAKLSLGRRFGTIAANRGVVQQGPYRILRHPMYAGYLLTHIAFFLNNATPWNAALYLIELSFQVARIRAEEQLLIADPDYQVFRDQVRYRLVPGLF